MSGALWARVLAAGAAFPVVTALTVTPGTFEHVRLGRSTVRYRDALALARMILEQQPPELLAGRAPVFALFFDMNVLWDRFVAWLFRCARAGLPGLDVSTQESGLFFRTPGTAARTVGVEQPTARLDEEEGRIEVSSSAVGIGVAPSEISARLGALRLVNRFVISAKPPSALMSRRALDASTEAPMELPSRVRSATRRPDRRAGSRTGLSRTFS